MQTADYNPDDFLVNQQSKMDEGLLVKFLFKTKQDLVASNDQGKPIFKEIEYVDIRVPGQKNFICRPAKPDDIARFPKHYDAFKSRTSDDELLEGTPLSEWPLITRSQVEELTFANVKTVEQLVSMPDSNASQFMGINLMKEKAKQWLELASEGKAKSDLADELKKRDDEIEELKAAVKALQVKAKPHVTKKKRGRPRKVIPSKE